MYKRPSHKDTDEDILQLQADFEQRKNTIQLAAKVASKKAATPTANVSNLERNVQNKDDVKAVHNLLGEIVERTGTFHSKERKIQTTGFPIVNRRKNEANRPTKSLQNPIVSNDTSDVHLENVKKLKIMTIEEIVEEKRSLEQKLSPEMIAFLKSRSKKFENNENLQQVKEFQIENYKNTGLDDVLSNKEPGNWLSSLVVEPEKLQWLKNTREDIREISENDEFEARFDLNGKLLPYHFEITEENRKLFHHGEEPNRPGYSIKELLHLSRSTVLQQRITALTCLEKCLEHYSNRLYDDIFELPIEQIFFVVRFSLDENGSIPVLEESLAALRYIFFSEVDEKCLDNLYFIGMEIELPEYEYSLKSDKEYTEIDDQQLAEIDLIKCLVRTNIFTRFTYIISTLKPKNIETVLNCLKLLLRLAQDSEWVRKRLFANQYLLEAVIRNFIPKISSFSSRVPCYNYPMVEALKLIRILILKNPKEVAQLLSSFKIVNIVTDYVLMDVEGNMYALLVQIEALGIWMALLKYWLYVEKFTEIHQLMLRILHFHINNTNLNDNKSIIVQKHCIIAINALILAYKTGHFETSKPIFINLLKLAFSKWLNQLNQLNRFETIHFQLIIALIRAVNELQLGGFSSFLKQLMSFHSYNLILKEFLSCSNLLFQSDLKPHKTTATFSNLETICLDADNHLIAALRDSGCSQMFMKSLTKYLVNCTESPELMSQFLDNCSVKKYVKKFLNQSQLSLVSNWFTEMLEKDVIFNVLLMLSKCSSNETFLMTFKFLNCCKLKDPAMIEVLFNTVLFPNQEVSGVKQFVIENLGDIQDCNKYYLNDKKSLVFDWLYKPLSCFLDENYDPITNMVAIESRITVFSETLKWIIRLDNRLNKSTGILPSVTNRFCKFSQIFLSSPEVFLNKSINLEVTNMLRFILNQNEDLNFDEEVLGFGNFENLYKKLLEQYQSCSHCDKTFANIILMPLMQTQNVKWRKIFWFEYEIVSKLITVEENELFVKLDRFLEPKEVDNSFKNYYKKILQDNLFRSRAPLLSKILSYHLAPIHGV